MPNAPDAIPPALTPDQWATPAWYGNGEIDLQRDGRNLMVAPDGDARAWALAGDDLPAVMALANAALPDGDPRKITRADIGAIRAYAELADWVFDDLETDTDAIEAAYERALSKLAALLPPAP